MKRQAATKILLSVSISWLLGLKAPAIPAAEVRLNGHTFTLPTGFEIELAAGPPLIERPIVADFDEQGRLYVADSSGSSERVEKQLAEKPHRIVRLEDPQGNGRFGRRTEFAPRMMFPEGAMWYDGSLYVAAPPSIWKLTDTKGDGVAERRAEWFQGKTLTGCANDLHGPYLGPDGWIYWCKGAFAKQTYERPGKSPFVTRASHIFRCRPDGSGIEPVLTGGMDNPVGVVFMPGGERILSATFLQHPGGGRRDGLIHAVYGGVYGKVHDVIEEHKRTSGEVMPVLAHLGPAAPCGLARYESDVFGAEFRDNLFATLFNLQKVTRHVLAPQGATFTSRDEDFLVAHDRDFHPTDVLEDADGSLLVIDTGGWYKLCCPTSQLGKPDVLGAIYRIRRTGAPRLADPRGWKVPWATLPPSELAKFLADHRPAVRKRAIHVLARRGAAALPVLAEAIHTARTAEARRNAVWATTQIEHVAARAAVRAALADPDETVRHAALHCVSLWRDHAALPQLLDLLKDRSPRDRRGAAEALGRIGDKTAVPALLAVAADPADRVLEHSITFALIEIADPHGTAAGLGSQSASVRRAAMIALDQMDGGALDPETVARNLAAADPPLKEAASWIIGRHPEWGAALAGFLRARLAATNLSEPERGELEGQLARFAHAKPIEEMLAERLGAASAPRQTRRLVLRAMAQSGLKDVPRAWIGGLARVLAGADGELVRQAVATARSLPLPKETSGELAAGLLRTARDPLVPADVRLGALAALPGGLVEVKPEIFVFLRTQLDPNGPVSSRGAAADVLSKAKLNPAQLNSLIDALKNAGPLEVDRLLAAFAQTASETVGRKLVAALKESSALPSLRAETLRARLAHFSPRVKQDAESIYAILNVDAAREKARLDELLSEVRGGDARRGQAVFNSPKAACASCHAIGYLGGHVGPDLTRIGQIRTGRDLLESIVFPSASFVRSYEPMVVATKDGRIFNGVLRKDAADEVVLATGANEEAHIARNDIEEMRPGTVSVMPAGLDRQLTPRELADLLAFLKACK